MHRSARFGAWLFVLLAAGCGGGGETSSPAPAARNEFRVEGRLLRGDEPAAGFEVVLRGAPGLATKSGADGRFSLARVPRGAYVLASSVAGYPAALTAVSVGGDLRVPDQRLPGVVTGRVETQGGAAIPGADVYVPGGALLSQTDAEGAFVLAGLAPGVVTLRAAKDGYLGRSVGGVSVRSGEATRLDPIGLEAGDLDAPPPALTSADASVVFGAAELTLTGEHFGAAQGEGGVFLGGEAGLVREWSDTQIRFALAPAAKPGLQLVTVKQGFFASNALPIIVRPRVVSVAGAGEARAVAGASLGTAFGAATLGGSPVTATAWSSTAAAFVFPAAFTPGVFAVVLTAGGETSNAVTTVVRPAVWARAPAAATAGALVELTGAHFGAAPGGVAVGGRPAVLASWSPVRVTLRIDPQVPPGAAEVALAAAGMPAAAADLTVVPSLSGVHPREGVDGELVTFTGANLGAAGTVTVGGVAAAVEQWSATQVTARVPVFAAAGTYAVTLTAGGVALGAGSFTLGPSIGGVTPDPVDVGGAVVVRGHGFGDATGTVTLGGVPLTVSAWGPSAVTATVPSTFVGRKRLVVTTATGARAATALVVRPEVGYYGPYSSSSSGWTVYGRPFRYFDAITLTASYGHTCGVKDTGAVWCWGINDTGELGDGTLTAHRSPRPVTGVTDAVSVAAGIGFTCALRATGGVLCWGDNEYRQLNRPVSRSEPWPLPITGLTAKITAVTAGMTHACALSAAGQVACWGDNAYGQLGRGFTSPTEPPGLVTGLPQPAVKISSVYAHTCALLSDASVWCWGNNDMGQTTGDGTTSNAFAPVNIASAGPATLLAAGDFLTCAGTAAGVKCWGFDITTGVWMAATPVTGIAEPIVDLTAGYVHACATLRSGAVTCWGYNTHGQIGADPAVVPGRPGAEVVAGVSAPTTLVSGMTHVCARTAREGVLCWGGNDGGQLGVESVVATTVPAAPWSARVVISAWEPELTLLAPDAATFDPRTTSPLGVSLLPMWFYVDGVSSAQHELATLP